MTATLTKAARVRDQVVHPIIDADGHFVEIGPILDDELASSLEEFGGSALRDRFLAGRTAPTDTASNLADRADPSVREQWRAMPSWWGWPTHDARDRATAHLPALLHERLDELGIDFTILYPSMSLAFFEETDEELSSALCRAVNRYHARVFAPYRDRCTVGALIPMNTPRQAVAELEFAVRELGMKSALIAGYARRPLGRDAYRLDMYGLDSEYDYDPFWSACVDLGVAPVVHSALQHHRVTRSISNYVFNHINGLAAAHESLCKSLFLGGVTRRFPNLRVGFLEGGVAWACSLFAGLVGHWEKRNGRAIEGLDPDRLDVDALMDYFREYGDPDVVARVEELRRYYGRAAARPEVLDEFAACEIREAVDLRRLFEPHFYFGCEADDPLLVWAFRDDVNPLGARLRPVLGSDISHWDVPDMTEPIAEAFELVERGVMTADQFRELTFLNPVRLHGAPNPAFFAGTVCESAATDALRGEPA
ncbi:MAG TPA: amidohydrolase family protein [Acidimicrobiia bacterium]|nr:amidohydrolase family protein [Acidimicrobiia bacterium]